MREILIANSSPKLTGAITKIITYEFKQAPKLFKSASELCAMFQNYENAVLILGTLTDKPSIVVARSVPSSWDVIILLSSNSPLPYYSSNITPINLPVNKKEFALAVASVVQSEAKEFTSKTTAKKVRSQEDTVIIEQAKQNIMKQRNLSESDAHRFLQRYSMNLGITLVECAKRFLK